ncbi:MAG: ankyrin repeat domain-containing protein [Sedimenticola sp.]|nr:ankyrin repeat domain-containing protein [Sedimenticola sp.]
MNKLKWFTIVFLLLLAGCSEPDKPTIALNLAVERGDINQIERHVQAGSDINRPNNRGETPLHLAATQGSYVIAKLLVKSGADIDTLDNTGNSALNRSVLNGHTQITGYLIKQGAKHEPTQLLHLAVEAGVKDRDIIPLLIELGAEINQQNAAGETPLTAAITAKNRVLVKLLVSSGADVNLANAAGERPLAIAEQQGDQDIQRLLQRNGAE